MPQLDLGFGGVVYSVKRAVEQIIPYLEDTGRSAHKAIYFDGWDGLAASSVLRAIAEHPPPSLMNKFDRIIHIDCSRWKSRRALQRAIVDRLKLPQSQRIMAAFDRQDMEDDFSGVDDGSRVEIVEVTREIYQTVRDLSCLVVFHNGSDNTVDMADFGFLPNPEYREWFSNRTNNKVLWTFRGMLRVNPEIKEKVDSSHLYIYRNISWGFDQDTAQLILEEATEVVKHTQHKKSTTPEIAAKCITYILWLHEMGNSTMDYNWATHASNYWVCDGIIGQQGQLDDESWEVSAALHKQMQRMEFSSRPVRFRGHEYTDVWKSVCTSDNGGKKNLTALSQNLTSFFLVFKDRIHTTLPHEMFQQSERLRVLKLSGCNFSFYSPPFRCCRSLRFLGLDHCEDQGQEEEDKQGRPIMEFFQSLWVLDISHTDWEFDLSQDLTEQVASNIREVHIKKGRIWRSNLSWRHLQKLCKLRVIEPTSSWETGKKDEFTDMVKLELLDLSGNSTMQVLPSLSSTTGLKTLVLDGCVGLDHIGPEDLPPSLESFRLDASAVEDGNHIAKISRITMSDCAKLVDFKLLGSLPNLEELDLSRTTVKTVNLQKEVQVEKLQRIYLMGCEQLRAIIWPENGMQELRLLQIDTRQGVVLSREGSHHSIVCQEQEGYCRAHICITDMRFLQSLVLPGSEGFRWITTTLFKLNLYLSCASMDNGKNCNSEKMGCRFYSTGQIVGSAAVAPKSLIHKTCGTYYDVSVEHIVTENDYSGALQFEPQDIHVEMGQEMVDINVVNSQGIRAIIFVMNKVQSLHMRNNSSIATVIIERMMSIGDDNISWAALKWCHVERCPMLNTVFVTNYDIYCFQELETIWVADLLMAHSIWSRGRRENDADSISFAKLRAIHVDRCPRLTFVLPLSWFYTLSSLETLHIIKCSDLRQVFPVEAEFLNQIATEHPNGMLEFPRLKDLYLYQLSSLRQICEAKMFAPKLKTVRLKGCWGLKRLPATSRRQHDAPRVVVDCEKDWWDSLEWDGLDFGHHPSLFAPSHSRYYKKRMLRGTVLR